MATELYRLQINSICGIQQVSTVMHFQGDNLTANDTFNNGGFLIDAFLANITSLWLAIFPAQYQLDTYIARRVITKPSVTRFLQNQPGAQIGTRGGAIVAEQLCPSVLILPPMGVKSAGKCFLPCVADADITSNQYDASYITDVLAAFSPMINGFVTSGKTWHLAIYSRRLNNYALAVGVRLSPRFGFLRRRKLPV
jgi:hypothetical protein